MIVTDYPDFNLIENLEHNVAVNLEVEEKKRVDIQVKVFSEKTLLLKPYFLFYQNFRDISGASPFNPY